METQNWERILAELRVPFSVEIVSWKPQTITRDRKRCLAVPYVETQPYQERLDKVCPDWQDDYAIWFSDPQETMGRGGEKKPIPGKVFVKCRLTIADHTRADVGECELTDENALTSAKAQAFKRTCSAFGLGRYLYSLPKAWVDFDEDKGIVESEIKRLEWALRRYAGGQGNGNGNGNGSGNGAHVPAPATSAARSEPASASRPVSVRRDPANGHSQAPTGGRPQAPDAAEASGPAHAATPERGTEATDDSSVRQAVRDYWMKGQNGARPSKNGRQAKGGPAASAVTAPPAGEATAENSGATGDQPESRPEAPVAGASDGICPIHNVPLQLVITREGKTLLLHKIEGEGYCNGEVVRPAKA